MRIDAHQHFWNYDPVRDDWITDDMVVLQNSFLPAQLKALYKKHNIDGCIAVQADQSEEETEFLVSLSKEHCFIKGVVGWVDLMSPQLDEKLEKWRSEKIIKGFRHILQAEEPGFMLKQAFIDGICLIGEQGYTYDILTTENQLHEVIALVNRLPDVPLVIDHLSKPDIKNKSFKNWRDYMAVLASGSNVYLKLSGMVTEAHWTKWREDDFRPYLDTCYELFGPSRLIFGSDWPVVNVAGGFSQALYLIENFLKPFSHQEQELIMGSNAIKFYRL